MLVYWKTGRREQAAAGRAGSAATVGRFGSAAEALRLLPDTLLMMAVLAGYLVWRWKALGGLAPGIRTRLGASAVFLNALLLPLRYAGLTALPARLCVEPRYEPIGSWTDPRFFAAVAGDVLALSVVVALWRRGHRAASAGVAFFFVSLLPVLNLDLVSGGWIAERYLYIPSIGFSVVAGLLYAAAMRRWKRTAVLGLCLVVGISSLRTYPSPIMKPSVCSSSFARSAGTSTRCV